MEKLEDGEGEGGGLAGAGLGSSQDIATGEHRRDGLGLNGGRLVITLGIDRPQQFDPKAEGSKWHEISWWGRAKNGTSRGLRASSRLDNKGERG
jgi:hypothetical protein